MPTREHDLAILTATARAKEAKKASPPERSPSGFAQWRSFRWSGHRWRSEVFLAGLRVLVAPLLVLALVMSFFRWRAYAIVVLPVLCYIGGLSLVYVVTRFRHLSDPLLFVPFAGLLSDFLFRTTELGDRPSRRVKIVLAVVLVVASVLVHATGLAMRCYQLAPIR